MGLWDRITGEFIDIIEWTEPSQNEILAFRFTRYKNEIKNGAKLIVREGQAAAFVKEFWDVRHQLAPDRLLEISVGFVMAFVSALIVVKVFLNFVGRSGFAPFAWYRIALGMAMLAAIGVGWL